jgi:hypothetical protein
MHGMGVRMVAEPEIDGTQEKWEIKTNEMQWQRQRQRWWA